MINESKPVEIKIKVSKDCNTCKYTCCDSKNKSSCEKWNFNHDLFNQTGAWFVNKYEYKKEW